MSYNPLNPNGQATMANSSPVVLASDQSAVPVSATNLDVRDLTNTDVVTAELSATDNAVLDDIAAKLGTIDTDTGGIATSAASIDTKTPALGQALAAASVPVILPAATITTLTPQTDALTDTQLRATAVPVSATDLDIRNLVNTDVVTAELSATDNAVLDAIAASVAAIDTDTSNLSVVGGGTEAAAIRVTIANNSTGVLSVDDNGSTLSIDDGGGVITVDGTITANLAAGTNNIGDVDVLSLPAIPAGTNNIGDVDIASGTLTTVTTLTGGGIAHDSADSGNPHKIGLKAESSPKGITLVADGDRTDAYGDLDGLQMVKLNTANGDLISERVSNTDGSSTAFTNFSSVASTRNYITGFSVFRTDAGTTPIYVDFRDGTGGSILWSAVIPPNGGANNPAYCGPALFRTSAATALAYDVSAATTTVYISVTGYQSKA